MNLDLGNKHQIDRRHLGQRVNNEGRLIGARVRHVTWLHTYHKRAAINSVQFSAGYRLGYLWNKSTLMLPARNIALIRVSGLVLDDSTLAQLSIQLREALGAVRAFKPREAAIDLSVFDMAMGPTRLGYAREGLSLLAEYFKKQKGRV